MIIICYLLGFISFFEFGTIEIFGGFVSKQVTDMYMNLDESKLTLNQFDSSILTTSEYPYISKVPFSFFSKYYISGLGTIPRWSKLHKRVNEYFVIAIKNNGTKNNNIKTTEV